MLVVGLVQLVVLTHLSDVLLEVFDLLAALKGLVGDLPHLSGQTGFLELLGGEGHAVLVEGEEGLDQFQEEKVIVVDEGGQPALGVGCRVVGVPLVSDFLA